MSAPNILDKLASDQAEKELSAAAALDSVTYDRQRDQIAQSLRIRLKTLDAERNRRLPGPAVVLRGIFLV